MKKKFDFYIYNIRIYRRSNGTYTSKKMQFAAYEQFGIQAANKELTVHNIGLQSTLSYIEKASPSYILNLN